MPKDAPVNAGARDDTPYGAWSRVSEMQAKLHRHEFGVLGYLTPGEQLQAAEHTGREQVDNGEDHSAMIPARKTPRARPDRIVEPHRIGGCRRELLDRTLIWDQSHPRQILRDYENHHNQHRPHRFVRAAAPLKPLPEPVDLEQYRVRRQARVGGMIGTVVVAR